MNQKTKYNYPELGWVEELSAKHDEGAILQHPSGNNYIRRDGNWQLLKEEVMVRGDKTYIRKDGNWRLHEPPRREGK